MPSKIGINEQSWIQEDYVKVYDAFYQSHLQNKTDAAMTAAAAYTDSPIKLIVNGRIIETDISPRLIDGRVMAPIRWIAEALGAEVKWEEETGSVMINAPNMSSTEDALKEAIVNARVSVRGKTEILKVKDYAQGYLVLILQ
ncbi:MAG: copper amine oxidase N-terminal domain-containing protein [Bacillota bacterium]